MNSGKVKCTCGWSWNKSDSSKKDMYICHECGRDNSNNMKNGGWLDNYGEEENYNDSSVSLPEGFVGMSNDTSGRNYSPAWGGQFQNGGKKKPIYVESKNDPRYRAYNDSLSLYKKTLEIENPKYYNKENGRQSDPSWYNWKGDRLAAEEFGRKNNIDYGYEYYQTGKFPGKIQPIRTGDWGEGMAYPIYKKPQQPVLIKTKAIQNNLHPTGSTNNLNISSSISTIRPKAKNAKSYKVKETVQGKYGPSTVDYEVTDPRNINMNDLGPGNTRVVTPEYAMGGSIPGAVGFTYARTKGIPSNGPHAKKTLASAQNGVDMYENPMLARRVDNPNVNRSYYDPRLNIMNIGTDYNTWKDEYTGELLTGDDLKYHQDKMLAHENYHAIQHSQDRDNYDIAHNTDNAQWAQMQKRPQMMTTDAVYNNFYNRSDFEDEQDYQEMINSYPESRILNENLLFDKVLDSQRYDNPANLEGEAKFYEDTGVDISKQQSELSLNPTRYQNGGEMSYYQHGLDWKPKGMENGGWLSKYDEAEKGKTVPPTNHHAFLRKLKNDAMNKKIAASKGRGRETNITQKDNTRTITPKVDKPITAKQKEQKEKRAAEQNKEAFIKSNVQANMEDAYESPLMSPGYFTPEGAAIGALQGATKMGPDLYEGNYKGAAMDALMMLPLAPSAIKTVKPLVQKVSNELSINKNLSNILKEGKLQGLSDYEIAKKQMEQVGITSNQRKAYTPLVSEFAEKYVKPRNYSGSTDYTKKFMPTQTKFQEIIENIKKGGYKEAYPERVDAWKLYLGRPQVNNTFSLADTAPAIHSSYKPGSLKGMDIYNINSKGVIENIDFNNNYTSSTSSHLDVLENPISIGRDPAIMGGYNKILTKQGTQYNDVWDLSPEVNLKSLFPNAISEHPAFENIFYKTLSNGVQSPRGFKIPVEKFVGKPFMSHGNLPYTSTDHVNLLRENILSEIQNFKPHVNTAFEGPQRMAKMQADLKNLENYPKYKQGGIIKDDMGQWAHPGEITEIGSNNITMQGVPYDVLGISDEGDIKLMKPGKNYKFKGKKVTEFPMAKNGVNQQDEKTLQHLDQLTNFTNYNKPQPGGWLNKYN